VWCYGNEVTLNATLGRFDLRISVCMCSKVDNFTYVYHFYLCVLRENDVCRTQCAMKLLFVDNMYYLIMMWNKCEMDYGSCCSYID
jgi:hypothetical protein